MYFNSFTKAAKLNHTTRFKTRYWTLKAIDPSYHPNPWGQGRKPIFSKAEAPIVRAAVWNLLRHDKHDHINLTSLCEKLQRKFSRRVPVSCMSRLLTSWRWSWKIPTRIQLQKFTHRNMSRYLHFSCLIQTLDWKKLKCADECHVVARDLTKKKVLGLVGNREWISDHTLATKSHSITLLTNLDPNSSTPLHFDIREKSNSQWDFVHFVLLAISRGWLVAGDYFLIDNASVHTAKDSFLLIHDACQNARVTLVLLPAYSPELNPCEAVFNKLKGYLRYHRVRSEPIWLSVIQGLATVTKQNMQRWYYHCLAWEKILGKSYYLRC